MSPLYLLDTAIVDSGSSGVYLTKGAHYTNVNPSAAKICIVTIEGQPKEGKVGSEVGPT